MSDQPCSNCETLRNKNGLYHSKGGGVVQRWECPNCIKDSTNAERQKKHRESDKEYFDRERERKRKWAKQAREKKANLAKDTP